VAGRESRRRAHVQQQQQLIMWLHDAVRRDDLNRASSGALVTGDLEWASASRAAGSALLGRREH
jgi:hypothetical protein